MKLLLLVTAGLLSAAAVALEGSPAGDHTYTVIINNTCYRDIRVAVHYQDPDRGWVTEGWWEVPKGSELPTGITASSNQFYMHGSTITGKAKNWPPVKSRKQYNSYPVLESGRFLLRDDNPERATGTEEERFSLKEISPQSPGLKARFDC